MIRQSPPLFGLSRVSLKHQKAPKYMLKDNSLTSRELNRATALKFFEFFFQKSAGLCRILWDMSASSSRLGPGSGSCTSVIPVQAGTCLDEARRAKSDPGIVRNTIIFEVVFYFFLDPGLHRDDAPPPRCRTSPSLISFQRAYPVTGKNATRNAIIC